MLAYQLQRILYNFPYVLNVALCLAQFLVPLLLFWVLTAVIGSYSCSLRAVFWCPLSQMSSVFTLSHSVLTRLFWSCRWKVFFWSYSMSVLFLCISLCGSYAALSTRASVYETHSFLLWNVQTCKSSCAMVWSDQRVCDDYCGFHGVVLSLCLEILLI